MRLFVLLLLILPSLVLASANKSTEIKHVIYITLDGVRWQEFYNRKVFFTQLWNEYGKLAQFYGGDSNNPIEVASVPISLPSYQSQMSGMVQPCFDNGCGRIQVETFPEKLSLVQHLSKTDVVVFASWTPIEFAVQHIPESIYVNAGNIPVYDPETHVVDDVMRELNRQQAQEPGTHQNRLDKYTFGQAMHYFSKYKPKFMWMSLVNADDAAHASDIFLYRRMLQDYDNMIIGLLSYLKKNDLYDKTLVIVTTDHGRGNGINWTSHGPNLPESKKTWAVVFNGKLEPDPMRQSSPFYSSLSIRPTVEKVLLNS